MSSSQRRSSLMNIDQWLDKCSNEEPDSIIYDPDYPNEVASSRAKNQIPDLEKLYKCIVHNCTKIGLSPDMIDQRIFDLDECISTFLKTIDLDLQDEFNNLCKYKQGLMDQVQKMLTDLYLPPYEEDNNQTLLQCCKKLKNKFTELNVVKEKRMNKLDELKGKQMGHCLVLGIEAPQIRLQTDIPTEDELQKLAGAVLELEKEVIRRKEKYYLMKELISKCMNELEYEPENDFERDILNEIPNYKEDHLMEMTNLHAKLEAHITLNKEKYDRLKNQLISLYERLDVPATEREAFFATHELCKPTLMLEMELEIERYVELKKQNISKFIDKIKDELVIEYERCFIGQEQQDAFFSLSTVSGECNEELLELYEGEFERIKKYYKENQNMLDKFQEWRQLWKKLIEIELKANDPNRFHNRAGKLLEEEKERKKLQRNLPKVEKELEQLHEAYSAKNEGKKFTVFDVNMDEFMKGCWDELHHAKEEEKKERQRAKMMSKPIGTPAKRPPSATRGVPPKTSRLQASATKITPKPSMRMAQSRILGSNNSMGSALSVSEPEFENMIVKCPSSKRRH